MGSTSKERSLYVGLHLIRGRLVAIRNGERRFTDRETKHSKDTPYGITIRESAHMDHLAQVQWFT